MPARGRSLKLYLVDGSPLGVITAELGASSVRATVASRTSLPELLSRGEAAKTGIYLLAGPDRELPGRDRIYVGEGDQVRTRLARHDADENMDFFTRAIFVVSKDDNLTKAHVRYLESRLIGAIRAAGRASLHNATEPPVGGLPESEVSDMERILDEIEILLPVVGFDILRPAGRLAAAPVRSQVGREPQPREVAEDEPESPIFFAHINQAEARAIERAGEFVVLAGSTACAEIQTSLPSNLRDLREALIESQTLVPTDDGRTLRFERDASFGSPSAASSLIGGYSDSGPRTWRLPNGQSYREWRQLRIVATERS